MDHLASVPVLSELQMWRAGPEINVPDQVRAVRARKGRGGPFEVYGAEAVCQGALSSALRKPLRPIESTPHIFST